MRTWRARLSTGTPGRNRRRPEGVDRHVVERQTTYHGAVAQSGERLLCKRLRATSVSGVSPATQPHSTDEPRSRYSGFRGVSVSQQAQSTGTVWCGWEGGTVATGEHSATSPQRVPVRREFSQCTERRILVSLCLEPLIDSASAPPPPTPNRRFGRAHGLWACFAPTGAVSRLIWAGVRLLHRQAFRRRKPPYRTGFRLRCSVECAC